MPQAVSKFVLEVLPWTLAGVIVLFLLAGHYAGSTAHADTATVRHVAALGTTLDLSR